MESISQYGIEQTGSTYSMKNRNGKNSLRFAKIVMAHSTNIQTYAQFLFIFQQSAEYYYHANHYLHCHTTQ